jgi:hypothetical protein
MRCLRSLRGGLRGSILPGSEPVRVVEVGAVQSMDQPSLSGTSNLASHHRSSRRDQLLASLCQNRGRRTVLRCASRLPEEIADNLRARSRRANGEDLGRRGGKQVVVGRVHFEFSQKLGGRSAD